MARMLLLLLLLDTKHCRATLDSRDSTVSCCFHHHGNFFSSLIDGCLKYKNKEKPKTGPRPGPRLNYDVKIGPKLGHRGIKKSGPVGPRLKCRALSTVPLEPLVNLSKGGCENKSASFILLNFHSKNSNLPLK